MSRKASDDDADMMIEIIRRRPLENYKFMTGTNAHQGSRGSSRLGRYAAADTRGAAAAAK